MDIAQSFDAWAHTRAQQYFFTILLFQAAESSPDSPRFNRRGYRPHLSMKEDQRIWGHVFPQFYWGLLEPQNSLYNWHVLPFGLHLQSSPAPKPLATTILESFLWICLLGGKVFTYYNILRVVRWYLIVVVICLPLIMSVVEHTHECEFFSCTFWLLYVFFGKYVILVLCPK